MSHPRKLIRKKVVDLLKRKVNGQYPTNVEERVYSSRITPYWSSELPAISVYSGPDRAEEFNQAPRDLQHDYTVIVEIVMEATTENLDDALDDIAEQVERVLSVHDTLEGCASDIVLSNTEITLRENGDQLIGSCRMDLTVEYYSDWPSMESLIAAGMIDDFKAADTQYSLNNEQAEEDRARDLIEVETV